MKRIKQLELKLSVRGGKRDGAGRKPKGDNAGVSHAHRPEFKARHPVHVTMRVLPGVGFLRGFARKRAIEDALREVKLRFGNDANSAIRRCARVAMNSGVAGTSSYVMTYSTGGLRFFDMRAALD